MNKSIKPLSKIARLLSVQIRQFNNFSKLNGKLFRQSSYYLKKYNINQFNQRFFASNVGETIPIKIPAMGESVSEGTIQSFQKAVGDYVEPLDPVVVVETDKITVDIPAGVSGIIQELKVNPGDTVAVGDVVFTLKVCESKPADSPQSKPQEEKPKEEIKQKEEPKKPKEEKVSPPPSAPQKSPPKSQPPTIPSPPSMAKSVSGGPTVGPPIPNRPELVVKMSRLRQRVAQRLKESQNTAAMLTTFQEINMGPLIDMRNQYKDLFLEKHKVKLGFMSAFVKSSCMALNDIPAINGVIEGDNIIYHQYVDMSIAVGTPTGLMVPVIRNAHALSFAEIEGSINILADKARKGKINIEDMVGGTFTISNGGVYGSLFGTPIINPPQSAILGMHSTKIRPVVENGQIVARPMMYIALTYDHRLVDGSEAVTFLCKVRDRIEDPKRMLLDI